MLCDKMNFEMESGEYADMRHCAADPCKMYALDRNSQDQKAKPCVSNMATLDWIADNERSSIILPKGQQGLLISSSTDAIYPEKSFENAKQLSMSLCPYRSPRSLGHC